MKSAPYLLFAALQVAGLFTMAQPRNLKFEHIGTEAGLSQSNVTCILRDSRGFMWFGTRDGLNKYDGYGFTVYRNIPEDGQSLSNNFVTDIIEDKKGDLWISTWGGGLNRYLRDKERFDHYGSIPAADFINTLMVDSSGNIWIGTNGRGLIVFDPAHARALTYTTEEKDPHSISDNSITAILESGQHEICIGTAHGGLNFFDRESNQFTRLRHSEKDNSSLTNDNIRELFEDRKRRLWIATRGGGLDLFDAAKGSFSHYRNTPGNRNSIAHNVVLSLAEDDAGNIWAGTENGGISILRPETNQFLTYRHDDVDNSSLTNNSIYSMLKDPQGNMWIGTYSGGINVFNKEANKFIHYNHNSSPRSLGNNNVLAILEDKRRDIWIGTDGGGLDLMDRNTGEFRHFDCNPSNRNSIGGNYVLSLCEDANKQLWAGTWGDGLTVINAERNRFKRYQHDPADPNSIGGNNVYSIAEDKDGDVWVATFGDGLDVYNKKTNGFRHYKHDPFKPNSLCSDEVQTLLAGRNGILWIGTFDGGLDRLDKRTGVFTHFVHQAGTNSLSNNSINHLYEDRLGNLWIGTEVGLDRLEGKTGHFTTWLSKDGLPNAVIFGILEDERGYLWISTNSGLSKFSPWRKTFTNFSVADGLQANEFKAHACFKSVTGKMYFGGINGFNEFSPDSIKGNSVDPPLVITRFEVFNKDIPIGSGENDPSQLKKSITETKELTLSYKSSVLSFEFASLNYTTAEKKHYSYRLEGFDKMWNDIGVKHAASYTNLGPGKYIFRVKGWNSKGEWSPVTVSIQITITAPFWQTAWFRTLAIIAILSIVVGVHRMRLQAIKVQKRNLEQQVEQRTRLLTLAMEDERRAREDERQAREAAEQASRVKGEFMANMSHELRTPMNAIIGFTDLVLTTEFPKPQREYLKNVQRAGYNLLGIINDILDFSKMEAGKLVVDNIAFQPRSLVEETVDMLAIKAFEKGLELICEIDPTLPDQVLGDPVRLQQILVNLLGNAVKFTEKGEIVVAVKTGFVKEGRNSAKIQDLFFSVKDTGIGIPPEKISEVFESFIQADSTTTRKYGGTGLGLTIAKNLAEILGGAIRVDSEPGKGSRFTLQLALEIVQERPVEAVKARPALRRVLVVDDNITNCHLMQDIFAWLGIDCTLCTSGMDALLIIVKAMNDGQPFDLIITDHQMPVMDGITLVKEIKRVLRDQPQPFILMLSSLERSMCIDDAEKVGIDMFLSKPVKLRELSQILDSIFEKREQDVEEGVSGTGITAMNEGVSVLVAEDEPVNMLLIAEVLGKMGFTVLKASNGKEAVGLLAATDPSLILMDVNMPEMDGLEATQAIRALAGKKGSIPIVALTADVMKEDRERCLEAGMNAFISKPFRLEEIVAILKEYILAA